MAKICVLGFYGRKNLGDEAFKIAFTYIFPNTSLLFLDIDAGLPIPSDTDMVVCGGGDIVCDYFIPKIENLVKDFKQNIVLLSAGIPYQSYISSKVLDIFDYIYLRNSTDIKNVSNFIGHDYVKYIPDIVFSIPPPVRPAQRRKVVGVFFHRLIASSDDGAIIMNSIVGCINYLYFKGYKVILYRFNTSGKSNADDSLINKEIKAKTPYCEVDDGEKTVMEMYTIIANLEFAICGRLHAHIMSIGCGTPLISLSSTRKTGLLMDEFSLSKYCIKIKETPTFYDKFVEIATELISEDISPKIKEVSDKKRELLNFSSYTKLLSLPKRIRKRKYNEREYLISYINQQYMKNFGIDLTVLADGTLQEPLDKKVVETICRTVCFEITKLINPDYLWGFIETMCNRPSEYIKSIDFMINDSKRKFTGIKKFNIDYFNQGDFSNLHRSGWPYVLEKLSVFNTRDGIYLDTYMDRSFHWGEKTLISAGVLPYTQNWVGIIHHTPLEEYTEYNVEEMFKKESLLLSLHMCKGIYTLSFTLAEWIKKKLVELNFQSITVENLYHPTEIVGSFWTPDKFKANKNKKVVNIGAWLRDMFAIYRLSLIHKTVKENGGKEPYKINVGGTYHNLNFAALKGKKMEHYFKPDIVEINNYTLETGVGGEMCRSYNGQNKWIEGLSDFINKLSTDVETIYELDNAEYDKLLSSNIVFLKLVDASACNTLMECVARNTPILINPLPAVIEILGEDYPLYYSNMYEANKKLEDYTKIVEAHTYIKGLNKDCINAEVFIKAIIESNIFQEL